MKTLKTLTVAILVFVVTFLLVPSNVQCRSGGGSGGGRGGGHGGGYGGGHRGGAGVYHGGHAHGYSHGHHGGHRYGWWGYPYRWGYPYWWGYRWRWWGYPYWWDYPYYSSYGPYYDPYYYPYSEGYLGPTVPPEGVIPPAGSGQQSSYWHFCQDPEGYYPYVKDCQAGWIKVVPPRPDAAPPSSLGDPVFAVFPHHKKPND